MLKSDYGCEGEEVIIGAVTAPSDWRPAWSTPCPAAGWPSAASRPAGTTSDAGADRQPRRLPDRRPAAGLYTRLSAGATDAGALSVAVEILP